MNDSPTDEITAAGGPGFPRWLKWGLLGALAVLIVGYGAIFLYAKVLNDSPDELDQNDLDAALSIDSGSVDSGSVDSGSVDTSEDPASVDEPATDASVGETPAVEPPPDGGSDRARCRRS